MFRSSHPRKGASCHGRSSVATFATFVTLQALGRSWNARACGTFPTPFRAPSSRAPRTAFEACRETPSRGGGPGPASLRAWGNPIATKLWWCRRTRRFAAPSPSSNGWSGARRRRRRSRRCASSCACSIPRGSQLTEAEWEVARLAADGLSNASIADRRGTTVRTVSKQLDSAYRKLGVSSRRELAVRLANR
ncbi:MAG: helix-turn-helix transcriptional regulator [Polyangiales bacterium]